MSFGNARVSRFCLRKKRLTAAIWLSAWLSPPTTATVLCVTVAAGFFATCELLGQGPLLRSQVLQAMATGRYQVGRGCSLHWMLPGMECFQEPDVARMFAPSDASMNRTLPGWQRWMLTPHGMLLGTGRCQVGSGGCLPHQMLLGTGRCQVSRRGCSPHRMLPVTEHEVRQVDALRIGYYQETLRAAEWVTPAVFSGPCTCEKCSSCHAGHVRQRNPKRRKMRVYVPVVHLTRSLCNPRMTSFDHGSYVRSWRHTKGAFQNNP